MSSTLVSRTGPWLDSLKGLFFPPTCLLCYRFMGLSASETVCPKCRPQLRLENNGEAADEAPLDAVFFLYRYGRGARRLVHRIKMTGDPRAGVWLDSELRRSLFPTPSEPYDAVVPVPSHRRQSVFSSGSGGADLWPEALGNFLRIPVRTALRRSRTVPKQTSLTRDRRLTSSESSLAVRAALLGGLRSVLLADDVMTTGATARACARLLKKSGVARVGLAVIARG